MQFFRAGNVGEFCGTHRRAGVKRAQVLFLIFSRAQLHLRIAQRPHQVLHRSLIRPQRLGLQDLPLVFASPELDGLFLGGQFDSAQLLRIECQQALVPQIVFRLLQAGFMVARDNKDPRIALERGVSSAAGRRVIAEQQFL